MIRFRSNVEAYCDPKAMCELIAVQHDRDGIGGDVDPLDDLVDQWGDGCRIRSAQSFSNRTCLGDSLCRNVRRRRNCAQRCPLVVVPADDAVLVDGDDMGRALPPAHEPSSGTCRLRYTLPTHSLGKLAPGGGRETAQGAGPDVPGEGKPQELRADVGRLATGQLLPALAELGSIQLRQRHDLFLDVHHYPAKPVPSSTRYRRMLSLPTSDTSLRRSFFLTTADRKPGTEWGCQPVASPSWTIVVPFANRSFFSTISVLVWPEAASFDLLPAARCLTGAHAGFSPVSFSSAGVGGDPPDPAVSRRHKPRSSERSHRT